MKVTPSVIAAVCLFGCAAPPAPSPAFVDERPGGRYYWRGDTLVICMLNMTPGATEGSDKLVLLTDYETCAPMQRVVR